MKQARDCGQTLREYLGHVDGLDLAQEQAYERVAGPQGSERDDWRFAWLASWICRAFGGNKDLTPEVLISHLRDTLHTAANPEPEIITDPDIVEQHREKVIAALELICPRPQGDKEADS